MSDITVTTTEGGTTVVTDTLGAAAAAAAAVVSAAAAATSASNASTSASNAASSASAASTSASTATTQAGNASTSASAAASSASAASTSASNASTSASNAASSASAASTSASNAATSASEAAASAAFLNPAAVAITGGTINGAAIGGTTAAAGSFTTLSATQSLTLGNQAGARTTFLGSTGTNYNLLRIDNTGGELDIGLDNSAGSIFNYGNYAAVFAAPTPINFVSAGTRSAVVSSTGLSVIGTLSATEPLTITKATGVPKVTLVATTGTNEAFFQAANTGGSYYFGVENSAGSWFGATAYAGVASIPAAKVFQTLIGGASVTTTSATGLAVTGADGITSTSGASSDTNPSFTAVGSSTQMGSYAFGTSSYRIAGGSAYAGLEFVVNNSVPATFSSTALTLGTGVALNATPTAGVNTAFLTSATSTTGGNYLQMTNTGGTAYFGIDSSTANVLAGGNYATVMRAAAAIGGVLQSNAGVNALAWTGSAVTLGSGVNLVMASGQYIEGGEGTAPAAPAANGFRIFAEDNGAGKTRLMVQFATGAAQQLAIEP